LANTWRPKPTPLHVKELRTRAELRSVRRAADVAERRALLSVCHPNDSRSADPEVAVASSRDQRWGHAERAVVVAIDSPVGRMTPHEVQRKNLATAARTLKVKPLWSIRRSCDEKTSTSAKTVDARVHRDALDTTIPRRAEEILPPELEAVAYGLPVHVNCFSYSRPPLLTPGRAKVVVRIATTPERVLCAQAARLRCLPVAADLRVMEPKEHL
jgi:hypothetical protein